MKFFSLCLLAFLNLTQTCIAAEQTPSVLATVNNINITKQDYDQYVAQWQLQNKSRKDTKKEDLLAELIQIELIKQEAQKLNIDTDPDFARQLEMIKTRLYIREITRRAIEKLTISDEMIQKKYNQMLSSTDLSEYRINHILTESEQDAAAVITLLNEGKTFSDLAKQKSIDTSGQTGGALGWVSSAEMDASIINAVKPLKANEYTQVPVQTQFGWHVILLQEQRQKVPYTLSEVRGELIKIIKGEHFAHYIQALHDNSSVTINPEFTTSTIEK
ncbi:MAG: hypothetical protein HOM11_02240 [Methylococcales bacterium]|jgi:peptidyl-prolyl cis-trans isomerase C|nr:hypothetical protein [Methylococcales bacterium]MBT7443191.1 hypothetical protein [Methylococcales bacterium]